ncbi:apolipoprotein Db [Acipenser oxyrinchus oxyrinchus]|uniref:Apolipoprotein D n=1 Tax=Acipenser oxyrinchus oxyrinchus TaxID=40147 RepID=A0AAD8D3P0_ACIOX|nr:apolipoprotein Db [Acipenser oxyrinchus oxyrinchus]
MQEMLMLLLSLIALSAVNGQTFHFGSCPKPPVQNNFELSKYLGTWYEIEKLPACFEKGNCVQATYSLNEDATIKVLNQEVLPNGKTHSIEGTAVSRNLEEPAKLGVSFSFFQPYSPYWVLSTDYESHSLVYSCSNVLGIFYVDFAWILARTRTLPAENVTQLRDVFTSFNIDITKMTQTDQTNCPNFM